MQSVCACRGGCLPWGGGQGRDAEGEAHFLAG